MKEKCNAVMYTSDGSHPRCQLPRDHFGECRSEVDSPSDIEEAERALELLEAEIKKHWPS